MNKPNDYIRIPLLQIKLDRPPSFPIYIHLTLNEKYICIRNAGDPISQQERDMYQRRGMKFLYVNRNDKDALVRYVQEVGNVLAPKSNPETAPPSTAQPLPSVLQEILTSLDDNIVEDILSDSTLDAMEAKEALSILGEEIFRNLARIQDSDDEKAEQAMEACKKVCSQILSSLTKGDDIYEKALEYIGAATIMKDHSAAVGSLASTLGLLLGISNKDSLGAISLAGIFHDFGLAKLDPEILQKPKIERSHDEEEVYRKFCASSSEQLKNLSLNIENNVLRLIDEIHECFDGSGFPKGLRGEEISDLTYVVMIANTLDNIARGRFDGLKRSPAAALKILTDSESPSYLPKLPMTQISILSSVIVDANGDGDFKSNSDILI